MKPAMLTVLGLCAVGLMEQDRVWFPMLIAWLVKGGSVRYGGMGTYLRLRPLFFGLIVSEFSQAVLRATISGIWRTPAPFLPWP